MTKCLNIGIISLKALSQILQTLTIHRTANSYQCITETLIVEAHYFNRSLPSGAPVIQVFEIFLYQTVQSARNPDDYVLVVASIIYFYVFWWQAVSHFLRQAFTMFFKPHHTHAVLKLTVLLKVTWSENFYCYLWKNSRKIVTTKKKKKTHFLTDFTFLPSFVRLNQFSYCTVENKLRHPLH